MPRLGALIAIIFWGISFVATKAALRELTPIALITIRFLIGTAVLLALLAVKCISPIPPRNAFPQLALMGFIGIFVHQLLQAHGLTMTSAMSTGWLIGLTPIWSAILAALFLRERFTAVKVAGLLVGFAGAVLVVTKGDAIVLPSTRGDLLILASTLNWAIYTIVGHPTIRRLGALRATAGAMLLGTLMLVPLFVARGGWREVSGLSGAGWGAMLFLAIGCSALGYFLWYGALEKLDSSRVAVLLYLEPLVTLAAAMILLGEPLTAVTAAGGLLVLAGVMLVQKEFS